MKGYTGYKLGEAIPSTPFAGGGSTFTGGAAPSYLSGLSNLASPEEWRTTGTAFIQNPRMLEMRAKMEQLGRQREFDIAAMGDPVQAGQRAYTLGREAEELERLRMANEARKTQSQMSFLPQMEALRGGIASRMASSLGVSLPQGGGSYSSGTGYTPSWMRNYQTPSFPRY